MDEAVYERPCRCGHWFQTEDKEEFWCMFCWYDRMFGRSLVHGYKYLPDTP